MATKKQKHQAALARREKFMEGVRADGLAALQRDRDRRARIEREMDDVIAQRQRERSRALNIILTFNPQS